MLLCGHECTIGKSQQLCDWPIEPTQPCLDLSWPPQWRYSTFWGSLKDFKQFISNCTKPPSVRNNKKQQFCSKCDSLLRLKHYRFELVIAQKCCLHLRGHRNVTCVLGRTIHVPPYSFTARFPNHLRKWLQEKKQTTHGCSGTVFSNGCYNCISCANRSVCRENRQRKQNPSKNGKAYLFLINCWHIVLNWMHSTCTDD